MKPLEEKARLSAVCEEDPAFVQPSFRAVMNRNDFQIILKYINTEVTYDAATRVRHRATSKFAQFRELWDLLGLTAKIVLYLMPIAVLTDQWWEGDPLSKLT